MSKSPLTETSSQLFFSSKTPEIPILDDIECVKENIFPLKEGRSVSHLSKLLSATSESRRYYLTTCKQEFEEELKNAQDLDDPLDPYYRFVGWTLENYPQGECEESGLVDLLERTLRQFDPKEYGNDLRYVYLWLHYADYVKTKTDVFEYMLRNDIGTGKAVFYETYAQHLEQVLKK